MSHVREVTCLMKDIKSSQSLGEGNFSWRVVQDQERERNSGMTRTNLLIARNELRMIQLHSLQGEKVLRVEGQEQ